MAPLLQVNIENIPFMAILNTTIMHSYIPSNFLQDSLSPFIVSRPADANDSPPIHLHLQIGTLPPALTTFYATRPGHFIKIGMAVMQAFDMSIHTRHGTISVSPLHLPFLYFNLDSDSPSLVVTHLHTRAPLLSTPPAGSRYLLPTPTYDSTSVVYTLSDIPLNSPAFINSYSRPSLYGTPTYCAQYESSPSTASSSPRSGSPSQSASPTTDTPPLTCAPTHTLETHDYLSDFFSIPPDISSSLPATLIPSPATSMLTTPPPYINTPAPPTASPLSPPPSSMDTDPDFLLFLD